MSKEESFIPSALKAIGSTPLVVKLPSSIPGQVSGGDLELVEERAQELVQERDAFRADQFQLEANSRAHYLHTGPEFIKQSEGKIQGFCDFAGTGGTFAGCAAALQLLKGPLKGKIIATTINDSGLKYLSTDLWK